MHVRSDIWELYMGSCPKNFYKWILFKIIKFSKVVVKHFLYTKSQWKCLMCMIECYYCSQYLLLHQFSQKKLYFLFWHIFGLAKWLDLGSKIWDVTYQIWPHTGPQSKPLEVTGLIFTGILCVTKELLYLISQFENSTKHLFSSLTA